MTTSGYGDDHATVAADGVEIELATRSQSNAVLPERLSEDAWKPRVADPLLDCALSLCVGHRVVDA